MGHFQQGMGSIEILGKSGRIERVYFDVKQSRLVQWNETQIKVSVCVCVCVCHVFKTVHNLLYAHCRESNFSFFVSLN